MRHPSIAAWLRHCIDPLGPRPNHFPRFTLSPRQTRKLLPKAQAHHVLPTVFQNIPLPADDPDFDEVREKANLSRIEGLALSAMLNHHNERLAKTRVEMGIRPDKDWSSHGADAFGLMAIAVTTWRLADASCVTSRIAQAREARIARGVARRFGRLVIVRSVRHVETCRGLHRRVFAVGSA